MSEHDDRVKAATKQVIATHRRALVGFAHYDRGEKVPGCDCCYCAPRSTEKEAGHDG